MRTPAGTECKYYYEDFNRGRAVQECRLIQSNPNSAPWKPGLCKKCPIPAILRANACSHMELEARVGRRWLVVPQVRVRAYCRQTEQVVTNPMVGCGHCHKERWQEIEEHLNT